MASDGRAAEPLHHGWSPDQAESRRSWAVAWLLYPSSGKGEAQVSRSDPDGACYSGRLTLRQELYRCAKSTISLQCPFTLDCALEVMIGAVHLDVPDRIGHMTNVAGGSNVHDS